ncbi:hypothetical protein ESCOMM142M_23825 [Escherichia coli]
MRLKVSLHRSYRIPEHSERHIRVFRTLVLHEAVNIAILTTDSLHTEQCITCILLQLLVHKRAGLQPQRR